MVISCKGMLSSSKSHVITGFHYGFDPTFFYFLLLVVVYLPVPWLIVDYYALLCWASLKFFAVSLLVGSDIICFFLFFFLCFSPLGREFLGSRWEKRHNNNMGRNCKYILRKPVPARKY